MTWPGAGARPGDFAVIDVHGPTGALIRVGQWLLGDGFADFEHAFVVVDLGAHGETLIVEAEPGGARVIPLATYWGRPIRVYRAPDEARDRIVKAAMSMVGTPYSFLDYVALALWRLKFLDRRVEWVARLVRAYVASTGHMICSQLVTEAYAQAGVELFQDGRLSQDVTPADLHHLIGGAR